MQRTAFKRRFAVMCCLLVLGAVLLLAACGNYSSPGGNPQATPTKGGYSLITLLEHEFPLLLR
jgi:hypothetical protein